MHKGLMALAAVVAFGASTSASADTFVITDFNGEFGSFSRTVTGDFDDSYTFTVSADGLVSSGIAAARVTSLSGITFSSVTLNGVDFTDLSTALNQFFSIEDQFVTAGTQTIRLVGSGSGSYGGSVSYDAFGDGGNPLPIPEPATWAMMIAGFGMAGAAMRRRQVKTTIVYA